MAGTLASLSIDGVITASASFALSESTVAVSLPNGVILTGATLLTVGLSHFVGAGGFGVSFSGGALGIALLEPPAPATGTDSRYWLAITASNLAGTLSLGAGVSASVQNGTVSINHAGGTDTSHNPATPINWTTSLDLNGDGQFGTADDQVNAGANIPPSGLALPITATVGQLLIGGSLTSLNIEGILTGSANFVLCQTTVDATVGGTTLTGATLMTVGLSGLTASAGAGVFGVTVSGGNLGIAVLEAPKPPTGTDSRYWVAVTASDLSGSLNLAETSPRPCRM